MAVGWSPVGRYASCVLNSRIACKRSLDDSRRRATQQLAAVRGIRGDHGHVRRRAREDPIQSGDYRRAIGELVTRSRCGGTWAAAFLASTQILAPRFGRLLTWSLAAAGVNDFLQAGFTALTDKANELEERAG